MILHIQKLFKQYFFLNLKKKLILPRFIQINKNVILPKKIQINKNVILPKKIQINKNLIMTLATMFFAKSFTLFFHDFLKSFTLIAKCMRNNFKYALDYLGLTDPILSIQHFYTVMTTFTENLTRQLFQVGEFLGQVLNYSALDLVWYNNLFHTIILLHGIVFISFHILVVNSLYSTILIGNLVTEGQFLLYFSHIWLLETRVGQILTLLAKVEQYLLGQLASGTGYFTREYIRGIHLVRFRIQENFKNFILGLENAFIGKHVLPKFKLWKNPVYQMSQRWVGVSSAVPGVIASSIGIVLGILFFSVSIYTISKILPYLGHSLQDLEIGIRNHYMNTEGFGFGKELGKALLPQEPALEESALTVTGDDTPETNTPTNTQTNTTKADLRPWWKKKRYLWLGCSVVIAGLTGVWLG